MAHRFCLLAKHFNIHLFNFKLCYYNTKNIYYLSTITFVHLSRIFCGTSCPIPGRSGIVI